MTKAESRELNSHLNFLLRNNAYLGKHIKVWFVITGKVGDIVYPQIRHNLLNLSSLAKVSLHNSLNQNKQNQSYQL